MPAHKSLRQKMSQRLSTTTGDIFHGLHRRSIGSSTRYLALQEQQQSTILVDKQQTQKKLAMAATKMKNLSSEICSQHFIRQKQNKPEAIPGTKMNIFGSDICSQDFILSKIEKVQISPSVVELEVDEIVAMEDFKIFDALSTLFLQKDRVWKRIKFRDSFNKPQDFQDFVDGRKSLLQRISNSSNLPISFQVKLNFVRGEHQREDYSDFLVKLQENQKDISRLVLSGDMTGSDPCDSKSWEALVDFLANKRNSRFHIKLWQRVSLNLFYYHDDAKKEHNFKHHSEAWKHKMLPIAICNLKKGLRCRSFHGEGSKMKKRPGVRRCKSVKACRAPDYHWELHSVVDGTIEK